MDLSIIILNYKQKGLVKQCIKGIVAAQPQLDYELIVVDNASGDNCLEAVEALCRPQVPEPLSTPSLLSRLEPVLPPLKTIQSEQNLGFAAGNNLGLRQAVGRYCMILNPDIAIVPNSLEKIVAFMDSHTTVGLVGPKLINPDGSIQDSCRRFPDWPVPLYRRTILGRLSGARRRVNAYLMNEWHHDTTMPVDWMIGACLVVARPALERVGLLDERFFMYFEDLDWCRRFWESDYAVYYFADVELVHYHQRLSAERSGLFGLLTPVGRIHLYSGIKYFAKYFGAQRPRRVAQGPVGVDTQD